MPQVEIAAVGRRLREAREGRKWRKSEAAAALGIKTPTYHRYEDGDRWPSLDLLLRASDIYDKRVGWFFEEAELARLALSEDALDPELRRVLRSVPRARQRAIARVLPVVNQVYDDLATRDATP